MTMWAIPSVHGRIGEKGEIVVDTVVTAVTFVVLVVAFALCAIAPLFRGKDK